MTSTNFEWLYHIPLLTQRQDALNDQLNDLMSVATRLGMYDAADWIYNQLGNTGPWRGTL